MHGACGSDVSANGQRDGFPSFMELPHVIPRWFERRFHWNLSPALDVLLAHADPSLPLPERIAWAEDFFAWVRGHNSEKGLKWLLQILGRQPEVRTRVARTFRSIVSDTQALDLFADTGLPNRMAFLQEAASRLSARLLPDSSNTRDLGDVFDRLFCSSHDRVWLESITPDLARELVQLIRAGETAEEAGWNSLHADLEDAMVQIAGRIRVTGSLREVRRRLAKSTFRDLPFQRLAPAVDALLIRSRAGVDVGELSPELNQVRNVSDSCAQALDEVSACLASTGVNVAIVYDLERIRAQLARLELLLEAWASPRLEEHRMFALLADLVQQNHAHRSVRELLRQNLHLLTRRIVEHSAEAGEHYVARTRKEYYSMLRRAIGGGGLTGVTTVAKLLVMKWTLAGFLKGSLLSLNYAASFATIQLCGFTLATKQPASTAPALARRMEALRDPQRLELLVDEIVCLVRSQTVAIAGNLIGVVPATILLHWMWILLFGHPVLDHLKASQIVSGVSPLSGAWVFAAVTGVFLWFSSVCGAWMENWFALRELRDAISHHRRLRALAGPSRSTRIALWLEHHAAGLTASLTLGLMLGLLPEVALFFGLPLEARHVTLSTGQLTAAISVLGAHGISWVGWVTCSLGILGIGAINVGVSFGCALFVAIRARDVRAPERSRLYRAMGARLWHDPVGFLWPKGRSVPPDNTVPIQLETAVRPNGHAGLPGR